MFFGDWFCGNFQNMMSSDINIWHELDISGNAVLSDETFGSIAR